MRNVKVERSVGAPRSAVWAVLADYPNIAEWNDGVQNSYAIGDEVEGVTTTSSTISPCFITTSRSANANVEGL